MKTFLIISLFLALFVSINGLPVTTINALDKINGNDPSINDVLSANNHHQTDSKPVVHSSDTPIKIDDKPEFKPKPAGTKFVTLIDDIFQIPISILQSVAKLITHPFKHEPEAH